MVVVVVGCVVVVVVAVLSLVLAVLALELWWSGYGCFWRWQWSGGRVAMVVFGCVVISGVVEVVVAG